MNTILENYISIANPPDLMYHKVMSVPDQLITRYFELTTDIGPEELAIESRALNDGENPRDVKQRLAERIVRQFHPSAVPSAYRQEAGGLKRGAPATGEVAPGGRRIAQLFLDA